LATEIRHIVEAMEKICPSSLAEQWDNVGLQIGGMGWPVRKIWVALDPTAALIGKAWKHNVDLVITHHPLVFKPLSAVDPENPVGKTIDIALRKRVGVFCAHTNLDSAIGGINDMLAEKLGINTTQVLAPARSDSYRLVTFIPEGHVEKVADALFASGAGKSLKYSHVSFRTPGTGTFKPSEAATPFIGRPGEITRTAEYRLELLVDKANLSRVEQTLLSTHPYEEAVYDVVAVRNEKCNTGLGRIGDLDQKLSLEAFGLQVKLALGLEAVRIVGDRRQQVRKVALCSGSGRSLLQSFLASDAEVFVSGDFGYHDGRSVEHAGRSLVDVGHFASEHIMVEGLVEKLGKVLKDQGHTVEVAAFREERDCFRLI
jgi:dinuclear metal center YbgI/SA1388 family protein